MNAAATYPTAPGFKTGGTSAAAAFEVAEDAATLRAKCYELIQMRGDHTADEVAAMLDRSVLSIRPRFTELFKMGWIFKSGVRRKNDSGMSATVWSIDSQAKLL
jgi:predicted ArsR family transcriptional regulator